MAYIRDNDGDIHRVHDDGDIVDHDRTAYRDRPVVVRERRSGLGWLTTLLALLLLGGILWATNILDVDLRGNDTGDGVQGGVDVQLNNPD